MTDKLFFDTDCISSFLWVKEENILLKLYPGLIILVETFAKTYDERVIPIFSSLEEETHTIAVVKHKALAEYFNPELDDPGDYAEMAGLLKI